MEARHRRVLLVTNAPTPYRLPLFDVLGDRLAEAGFALTVVFGAEGYGRRRWEVDLDGARFDHVVLASRRFRLGGDAEKTLFLYGGLGEVMRRYRPDVVVVPGFSVATLKAWAWTRPPGRPPYLIWSGSIPREGRPEGRLRAAYRRMLARDAAGGVAYGTQSRDYLRGLGVPDGCLNIAINTVDTAFFRDETARCRAAQPEPPAPHLLYVGYLSPRKNVRRVLDVVARLGRGDVVLDVAGDGEERAALEAYAEELGLGGRVRFHGYVQRDGLPALLARARCLLFQTDFDIWGLTLVEAMVAGLPCLASVHAGATRDLVEDGVNGFAVDFADVARAAERVAWVLDHPAEAERLGRRASRTIDERAGLAQSADGFVAAIRRAVAPQAAPVITTTEAAP